MESSLEKKYPFDQYLPSTKKLLRLWALKNNIIILDAGKSELYGCKADEFIDDHHATAECYRKVFAKFWHEYLSNKIPAELYTAGQ